MNVVLISSSLMYREEQPYLGRKKANDNMQGFQNFSILYIMVWNLCEDLALHGNVR